MNDKNEVEFIHETEDLKNERELSAIDYYINEDKI